MYILLVSPQIDQTIRFTICKLACGYATIPRACCVLIMQSRPEQEAQLRDWPERIHPAA